MPAHDIKRSILSLSLSLSACDTEARVMTTQNNVKILTEVDGFIMPRIHFFPCLNDIHKRIPWVAKRSSFAKFTPQHCHGNGRAYFVYRFSAVFEDWQRKCHTNTFFFSFRMLFQPTQRGEMTLKVNKEHQEAYFYICKTPTYSIWNIQRWGTKISVEFCFYFSNNSHCLTVRVLLSIFLSQYIHMENKALTVLYSKPSFCHLGLTWKWFKPSSPWALKWQW